MGADIYLESIWSPIESRLAEELPPIPSRDDLNKAFEQMAASGGYFRNGYNNSDIMWAMGLSWSDTVGAMLDGQDFLPIEKARELVA
jgi:hypothetical protein